MLFNAPDNPQKLPLSVGDLDPHLIRVHGSLGPGKSAPKQHLDRFSHFCRDPKCDKQTDRAI